MLKFVALFVLFAAVVSGTRRLDGKTQGGEETTIEAVPFLVSIQYFGSHGCSGSIIGKHWVLTGAHCFHDINYHKKEDHVIHAGSSESAKPASVHNISELFVHPNYGYHGSGSGNDIALIRVEEPFEFDETRQPIEIFKQNEESEAGVLSAMSGWGRKEDGSLVDVLNLVYVRIISKEKCSELWGLDLLKSQICAVLDEGDKDSCQGDSGGPLTINGRLTGIVSLGIGCYLPGKPGIYTEVAYYHDWIINTVLQNS